MNVQLPRSAAVILAVALAFAGTACASSAEEPEGDGEAAGEGSAGEAGEEGEEAASSSQPLLSCTSTMMCVNGCARKVTRCWIFGAWRYNYGACQWPCAAG